MKIDKIKTILIYLMVFIVIFVTVSFTDAYAMEPYTKKAELICDNTKIQIITKCVDDSYTPFPSCIEQQLLFIEQAKREINC